MAECFDVGTEAKEDASSFYVAGLQLPLSPLFSPESAARSLALKPQADDVILSSYPRCDSLWVDLIVWKLLYTDLRRPTFDRTAGSFLPCQEMTTAGLLADAHDHAARNRLPRLYKTYFPFRLVPFYRRARYIYVIRSPWDACAAHYRFLSSMGSVTDPFDDFFEDFLEGGVPYGSYFRHVAPWNRRVGDSNVLILCREHVEHSPRSALFKVAAFLGERHLKMLLDNPELERDILGGLDPTSTEPEDSRGTVCNERQLNEIVRKVTQHFRNTSIEFLWQNMFQKQVPALVR